MNTSNYQQKNDVSVDDFVNSIRRDYDDEILFDVFIRGNQEARIILSENNDYDLMEPLYQIGKWDSNAISVASIHIQIRFSFENI